MKKEITIYSSSGELVADAVTGVVVDASAFSGKAPARIDVSELQLRYSASYLRLASSFDILDVGSWDEEGNYEPPCAEWQADTKKNVLADLSNEMGVHILLDDVPDDVFWRLNREGELKAWVEARFAEIGTHAPLPWHCTGTPPDNGRVKIGTADDFIGELYTVDALEANARFIEKACNNHDSLLQALLRMGAEILEEGGNVPGYMVQAIAKAQGEEA